MRTSMSTVTSSSDFLPQRPEYYKMMPFTTFVIKVASRCNLKCVYCYMYEHADQTWRNQPVRMSQKTVDCLAVRLREYADQRQLKRILVIAHGGEPLLIGSQGLKVFYSTIKQAFAESETELSFGLQTNGTLVDEDIVDVLRKFDVRAGVSIDGPAEWNDKFRVDAVGKGSFSRIMAGVEKLRDTRSGPSVFGGFLAVANPNIKPIDALTFFEELKAPALDFLLPDFNYDTYPYSQYPLGTFGNWFVELFDVWLDTRSSIQIRTFHSYMKLILGAKKGYDACGEYSNGVLVVETDGTYHALDVLKTAYHGATYTGKSLATDSISVLETEPIVIALSVKPFSVVQKCLDCELLKVCGGGYLPHRYSNIRGFNRESVYCTDLMILIKHISFRLSSELAKLGESK